MIKWTTLALAILLPLFRQAHRSLDADPQCHRSFRRPTLDATGYAARFQRPVSTSSMWPLRLPGHRDNSPGTAGGPPNARNARPRPLRSSAPDGSMRAPRWHKSGRYRSTFDVTAQPERHLASWPSPTAACVAQLGRKRRAAHAGVGTAEEFFARTCRPKRERSQISQTSSLEVFRPATHRKRAQPTGQALTGASTHPRPVRGSADSSSALTASGGERWISRRDPAAIRYPMTLARSRRRPRHDGKVRITWPEAGKCTWAGKPNSSPTRGANKPAI